MVNGFQARRHPRFDTRQAVRIIPTEGGAIPGTMQNISRGGTLVALRVQLELGRTYQIEVTDSQGAFYLTAEALRLQLSLPMADGKQPPGFRIGFRFVEIDAAAAERLDRLLDEVAAQP